MPRLPPGLVRNAKEVHPYLPYLLRTCRDLQSAKVELRWLQEHVRSQKIWSHQERLFKFRALCRRRGQGVPIQYLLGSEYFGPLELQCRPGVLIPRQATADTVLHLLELLKQTASELPRKLRVLDLCSGTGCISLLFGHSFPYLETNVQEIEICGIDISSDAISLAEANRKRIIRQIPDGMTSVKKIKDTISNIKFIQADVLGNPSHKPEPMPSVMDVIGQSPWDIFISNPPYISPSNFKSVTSRSVRLYEPKLALVPKTKAILSDDEQGDLFYPHLLKVAKLLQPKLLLLEVGDMNQARRVARQAQLRYNLGTVEIWKDTLQQDKNIKHLQAFSDINIIGSGDGRSVLYYTTEGASWIGRSTSAT
jgi:HemK-like putative methylase